jgi:undecaprenyl phosphate-alpha-L-ara4FN deformylase
MTAHAGARVALKISVTTLRGALVGAPALAAALQEAGAHATFFCNVGPDRSGLALRPFSGVTLPRELKRHYGFATLINGLLRPAPDVGTRAGPTLQDIQAAGFEMGLQAWDSMGWHQDHRKADNAWIETQFALAIDRFQKIFGKRPQLLALPDWQTTRHALRLTQRLGFTAASDSRGGGPFVPLYDAEPVFCPQIPTTLPALSELLASGGNDDEALARLLTATEGQGENQVLSLRAEVEGMRLLPLFRRFLAAWQERGGATACIGDIAQTLKINKLPQCRVHDGEIPGHTGSVFLQGTTSLPAD